MYNRYIPSSEDYTWTRAEEPERGRAGPRPDRRGTGPLGRLLGGQGTLSALWDGEGGGGLSGMLRVLHLENVDTGDILLLLIVLYLLAEGDDLDLPIALGLVLLLGLGED